eukprot:TCONS_00051271-protein
MLQRIKLYFNMGDIQGILLCFLLVNIIPVLSIKVDKVHQFEETLIQSHLPILMTEAFTILDKYHDFSTCLPLWTRPNACLTPANNHCNLPPITLLGQTFPVSGTFDFCPLTQIIHAKVYAPNIDIKVKPIRYQLNYNKAEKILHVSAKIQKKVTGLEVLQFIGSFKFDTALKLDVDLSSFPKLQYSLELHYSIRQKNLLQKDYKCVSCNKAWRRSGQWNVSPLLYHFSRFL